MLEHGDTVVDVGANIGMLSLAFANVVGNRGKVVTDFGGGDSASGVVVQSDGKIVVAGEGVGYPDGSRAYDFALARYLPDGRLDPSFGNRGRTLTGFGPGADDYATGVALQHDGKIVAAGVGAGIPLITSGRFAVARYDHNGHLDPTFGAG